MTEGTLAIRRAVAKEMDWEWCEEHGKPRWDGADPCRVLHGRCPTCGSEYRTTLEPPCAGPDDMDLSVPLDEFADNWHFEEPEGEKA